jgi:metal transporter CNNM
MTLLTWIGILLCLSQSAMFSGLNLGLFSLSKLELEVEAHKGNVRAKRLLGLRQDANFALVTILWGNVGVNVLLALLSGSMLSGVAAFLFSTVVITIFAEIIPQSYFTRHGLRMASLLAPVLRFYQVLLYPVARPTAWVLDAWLGGENVRYYPERDLRRVIQLHMEAAESDIARVEGQGALNFLELDDVPLRDEGEPVDPESILRLEFDGPRPVFPTIRADPEDPFLRQVNRSGKSWVVLVDAEDLPRLVLSANDFLREAMFAPERFNPLRHCHRPIIVSSGERKLGELIPRFRLYSGREGDDIVEDDVVLSWGEQPRLLTGTDILGRLLRNIAGGSRDAEISPGRLAGAAN